AVAAMFLVTSCSAGSAVDNRGEPDDAGGDRAVAQLLESNPAGLIYVWSPHMPDSVRGIETVTAGAQALDLPLEVWRDPRATSGVGPAAHARVLWEHGLHTHYPALFVYRDRHIVGSAVFGIKSEEKYTRIVESILNGPEPAAPSAQPAPALLDISTQEEA